MPEPLATALGWFPFELALLVETLLKIVALLVPLLLTVAIGMRLWPILKSTLISTTGRRIPMPRKFESQSRNWNRTGSLK